MQQNQSYFLYTFGCQSNIADSEQIAAQLDQAGFKVADKPEDANVIILNTCCIRESAERKIYGKIGELKRLKALDPTVIIGVAGCLAQKEQKELFRRAPHLDFVMGTFTLSHLLDIIKNVTAGEKQVLSVWEQTEHTKRLQPVDLGSKISAWVPIMFGCDNYCSYCIVPYVRGRERSREPVEILQEVTELINNGIKEITLLGQNVNSYGRDINYTFADLLNMLNDKTENIRIRYMTSHPRDFNQSVINVIKNSPSICEHVHLPVQSGSDYILQAMNRGYDTLTYKQLVTALRQSVPGVSLTTDLIVGFPGETDELFHQTLEFVREICFDAAYTFLYSQRSGTPAATMPDQIPLITKKQRLQQLMAVQNEISLKINQRLIGELLEVMVEGPSKNDPTVFVGRTRSNKIVLWPYNSQEQIGDLILVKIDTAQTWLLKGRLETIINRY